MNHDHNDNSESHRRRCTHKLFAPVSRLSHIVSRDLRICLVASFFVVTAVSRAGAQAVVADTAMLIGAGTTGPYWLSGFHIVGDSVRVLKGASGTIGYHLDANNGRIEFDRELTERDTVVVAFNRLGFALRSSWSQSLADIEAPGVDAQQVSYVPTRTDSSPFRSLPKPARLQWQGHKSFSLSASDHVASDWSQGMELSVSGELTSGLRLSAALSDRQIAQGARSTYDGARLGDLDRFYIDAQSRRFHGRWGELRLQSLGAQSRRVTGIQTHVIGDRQDFGSYLARSQGEARRTQIQLRDGVYGPYAISGSVAHAQVVEGSQSVWLDGVLLSEGIDADYTFDAARGTLTLAPHLTVTRMRVLTVEFEESLDDYRRTMVGASWGWNSHDSMLTNSMSFGWEGDDPASPLLGSLSEQQQDLLSTSPDGQVRLSASERVGERDGDYTLEVRDDGDSVFVYAGPEQGDWKVRFTWVGEAAGRYRHLVDQVYEFVGAGNGHYDPVLLLVAPDAEATLEDRLRLSKTVLGSIALDWQGVATDPNRFSSGSSMARSNHRLIWSSTDADHSGRTGFRAAWEHQTLPTGSRRIGTGLTQFVDEWRLRGARIEDAYDQVDGSGQLLLSRGLTVEFDAGRFSQSDLDAWRSRAKLTLAPVSWLQLEQGTGTRWLETSSDAKSRTVQFHSSAQARIGKQLVEAGWRTEDIDDHSREFTYHTDAAITRWLSIRRGGVFARHEWRRSRDRDADWVTRDMETSIGLQAQSLGASSGGGLTAMRGVQTIDGGTKRPFYGGRLNGTWIPQDDLNVTADLNLSHRLAGQQREVYLPTRPGQGDYRFERGEYIPDPQGDYRRVLVEDESDDASAYDAVKSLRLNWRPRWKQWRGSIDASHRIDARYAPSNFSAGSWFVPWAELDDAVLSGARLVTRDDHRVIIQPRDRSRATLLFALERQLGVASSGVEGERQQSWRCEGEWREDVSANSYVAIGALLQRRTRSGIAVSTIDSDARAALLTIGHSPVTGVGLSLEGRHRIEREFHAGQTLTMWGAKPKARVTIGGLSGSLTTDFTWLGGDVTGYLSPFLAEGRPVGFSFTESAELRWQLPARVSLNARVFGDHRPHEADRWRMHIETVATF